MKPVEHTSWDLLMRDYSGLQRMKRWLLVVVLGMTWPTNEAAAHPHVFITVETEVLYNSDKAIIGFRHKWTFDEMYTTLATQDLDANGDGAYSAAELKGFLDLNISSLKEFDYFTFPTLSGKLVGRDEPKDYSIEYEDEMLILHLTVPLSKPIPFAEASHFALVISDPSYYVDFAFAEKNPVRFAGAPAGCGPVIQDPRPDPKELARLQALGNDYFADPQVASQVASLYAKIVTIKCAAQAR